MSTSATPPYVLNVRTDDSTQEEIIHLVVHGLPVNIDVGSLLVELTQGSLTLEVSQGDPPGVLFRLQLPCIVDPNRSQVRWSRKRQELKLTLPVQVCVRAFLPEIDII